MNLAVLAKRSAIYFTAPRETYHERQKEFVHARSNILLGSAQQVEMKSLPSLWEDDE
ncbi:hypothetical protein [Leptolyngbya sp. FACHB-711]|uniref:hypothetical protein n=1 Tax=unclassified Leptolyngbya TaxID=2650499 RepID=UPI00168883FC|nr:hypothetical protein [Leptolyngbya sp. FACHB-711]MBD1852422.1 hypothetical protein [Cyanobacteria bacterium FACHB-502]MBD2024262.1 hypothetical protein [Leptolyngbya sp. FACHB-711]